MTIIKAENLNFNYQTYDEKGNIAEEFPVLRDISLEIPEGQFVAVLGHNGSGKSTLAKHFNGILTPTAGKVTVAGMDVSDDEKIYDVRQTVGMVFQNPDNQIVAAVVEEDVAFALENLGVPPDEIRRRIDEAMKTVDIYKFKKHAPHRLSGGQKQRVAIAGVIAMEPRCIVLDEPTAMLDPKGRRSVMKTVKMLNREKGITIVYITHYMEEAAQADRIVVMDGGRVIMDGVPREIFSRVERLKEVGLDVPQTTELMYELNKVRPDLNLRCDIIDEDECAEELLKFSCRSVNIKYGENRKTELIEKSCDIQTKAVETKNLCYKYSIGTPFEVTAVDNVSLTVEKGGFAGIIGHTGSGKSTFIQHLNGLLKQTTGDVEINGRNIWSKETDIRSIRFEVGLVFQYSEHQLFEETVFKDISFGPKNMGLSDDVIRERVLKAADAMGVHDSWLERSPFDLSGGQKRRVALAGVIAMEPKILILDEPAAGLDPRGREKVLGKIAQYHKDSGITILLVSHSMEDIVRYADKVVVMNKGGLFLYGTAGEVFSRSREITEIGLDVPQITRLSDKLRENGLDIGYDVYTTERARDRLSEILDSFKNV